MITIILLFMLIWRGIVVFSPDANIVNAMRSVFSSNYGETLNLAFTKLKQKNLPKWNLWYIFGGVVCIVLLLIAGFYYNEVLFESNKRYSPPLSSSINEGDTNATVVKAMALRIRPNGREVRGTNGIPVGSRVQILDACSTNVGNIIWCKIRWGIHVGYCSGSTTFLSRD